MGRLSVCEDVKIGLTSVPWGRGGTSRVWGGEEQSRWGLGKDSCMGGLITQ